MEAGGFSGKICLVTGGASGIGQSICRLLAKLGATVIIADVNIKMAEDTKNGLQKLSEQIKHSTFQVDVSSLNSVKSLADQIMRTYSKPPTVIIHCAGIFLGYVDSTECTEETWSKIIDVNLKGTFFVNQVFVKLLKDHCSKGAFVNISSVAKDGLGRCVAYSASKAGVEGIMKSLAKEYAGDGLRFNNVAPGFTKTPLLKVLSDEFLEEIASQVPMKRAAMPEEIASVCVFLASDASSYVNGATVEVAGGIASY